jgi:hypothetical protein
MSKTAAAPLFVAGLAVVLSTPLLAQTLPNYSAFCEASIATDAAALRRLNFTRETYLPYCARIESKAKHLLQSGWATFPAARKERCVGDSGSNAKTYGNLQAYRGLYRCVTGKSLFDRG